MTRLLLSSILLRVTTSPPTTILITMPSAHILDEVTASPQTPFYKSNRVKHGREEPAAKQVAIRLVYISYKGIWEGRK